MVAGVAECVFCGIVSGTVPAFVVASEESGIAFLDTRPVFPGHTLVIPRPHIATLADLPAELLPGYFALVQRVAVAVEAGMAADGTFVAMNNKVSQSVPHLHTHAVPRRRKDGLRGFFWPRTKYGSDAEARAVAADIAAAFTAS
jgi:histidine triad (HIT) family protein